MTRIVGTPAKATQKSRQPYGVTMAQGRIKRLTDRGYGFITGEERADLFFHGSAVVYGSFDTLRVGDAVTYRTEPDPRGRGLHAVEVRRVTS
jgi:CspA family cold shock protein